MAFFGDIFIGPLTAPGTFVQPDVIAPANPSILALMQSSGDMGSAIVCGYLEALQAQIGNGWLSGGEVTLADALSVVIAPFSAFVGTVVGKDSISLVPNLADDAMNYIFLRQDGQFTPNVVNEVPSDSHGHGLLWTVVTTAAGLVTDISNERLAFLDSFRANLGVQVQSISLVLNNGSSALEVGQYVDAVVEYDCVISQNTLLADQSGSVVIDLRASSYADYDDSTHPVIGDSICASAHPTLSSAVKSKDSTLTAWSVNLAAGTILRAIVVSATTLTQVTLSLKIVRK